MKKEVIVISAVWCPSCLILKKSLKEIHNNFNIDFKMLDYDIDEEIVKKYDIGDKLPVMIYDNKRIIGEKTEDEIIDFLKECELI